MAPSVLMVHACLELVSRGGFSCGDLMACEDVESTMCIIGELVFGGGEAEYRVVDCQFSLTWSGHAFLVLLNSWCLDYPRRC
ncbi:hypothetical protein M758_UG124800 [Ceratodon purpureus]|nr:hypothetical protein M758_UG124800 [Ceratodon purpureus]